MTSFPLVSIVMGTYNGEAFLDEQMKSLLAQTYPALEFVIMDDSSTDSTYSKLVDYASKDERIRVFQNEVNVGYNLNFEQAMKAATGEIIAIADQDDIWEPAKITELMAAWKDESIIMMHSPSAYFKTGEAIDWNSARSRVPFTGKDVRKFFLYNHISGHNMLFKKRLLDLALPFPADLYYDWWLAAVATCNGGIGYVNKVLAYHRIHTQNASGFTDQFVPFYKHVLATLPTLLTIKNLPADAKRFGEILLHKYKALENKAYSVSLNLFLFKHARIIFSFKKKRFPYFSYIKHSRRIASASFLRKEH